MHQLVGFGQFDLQHCLADPGVQAGVSAVVQAWRDAHPAAPWPEDARLDAAWLGEFAPDLVRRWLAVPRCTNTLSLYLWLLVDLSVQVAVQFALRRLMTVHWRPPSLSDEKWIFLTTLCLSFAVTTVVFRGLQHWAHPSIAEPHLLLRLLVAGWFYVVTHRLIIAAGIEARV